MILVEPHCSWSTIDHAHGHLVVEIIVITGVRHMLRLKSCPVKVELPQGYISAFNNNTHIYVYKMDDF